MQLIQEYRAQWNHLTRWVFRFVCLYFSFYIFSLFLGGPLQPLIKWVGELLQVEGPLEYFQTGSGDTTIAYVKLVINSVFAVLGTLLWSILDRKRSAYNDLFYWFLVIVRIYLIYFLCFYGFVKIFKTQFPSPSLWRLLEPVGEMSPMGLAWTYLGHSEGFNFFMGAMEVLGGLLLIPRRTQTLGALIIMGVMTQVSMINFFYDVPVKQFSLHLIAMAALIFSTDIRRFVNVFLFNEKAQRFQYHHPIKDKTYDTVILWLKVGLTVILIGLFSYQGYNRERIYGDKREKPALYGIWEAEHFILDNDTLLPLITDEKRWRYLIIDQKGRASVKTMRDSTLRYQFEMDSLQSKISMYMNEKPQNANLNYTRNGDTLLLKGFIDLYKYDIRLVAKDLSKMRLTNRGFHWINEYPYNR